MRYWTIDELLDLDELEGVHRVGLEAVRFLVERYPTPAPRLLRFGASIYDADEDCWAYEFEIELAPGVILAIGHGFMEGIREGWAELGGLDEVLATVGGDVDVCLSRLGELADVLHDARVRARKAMAGWQDRGVPSRLVDVRLAPCEEWLADDVPNLIVLIEGLDERLAPAVEEIRIGAAEELERRLEDERVSLAGVSANRARLLAAGASGTVDQFAINALAHFGDVAEGLRRLRTEERFWLPDDTAILIMNGHVSAGSGNPHARVDWFDDWMTVTDEFVSEERLGQAIGRPVAELFEHPFLSEDMTVVEAKCEAQNGRWSLSVRYAPSTKLFCLTSGRTWGATTGPAGRPAATGDVVPFPHGRVAA